ncbi:MAG: hypothetical protein C0603_04605 [Denitrovibrio sp.]|nr:MAG: hypothetical protein C0603_04605 [Denitrovibrio sp.]
MFEHFFMHMLPKKVSENGVRFKPTLYLGAMLVMLFMFLSVSGLLLLFYYTPERSQAFASILFLEEKVFLGSFFRSFHRMSSHIFLIVLSAHMLRVIFSGAYKVRTYSWRLGLFIFTLIIFEAYAGYLLPMDQLSWWAAKTGLELMKSLPIGGILESILAPDGIGSRLTLTRYFALHIVVIPMFLIVLVSVHMFAVRRQGLSIEGMKVSSDKLKSRLIILFVVMFMSVIILSIFIGAPLTLEADPTTPPNPAKSAWFLLWLQEIVSWRTWYINFVMLVYITMFFLPELSRRKSGFGWFSFDDRPVWISVLLMVIIILVLTIIAMFFRGADWSFGLYFS